jgi:uncharacterized membrane protein YbaN (DUF454 family)
LDFVSTTVKFFNCTQLHHRSEEFVAHKITLIRYLLMACGCLSVALGIIGIFLPLLPTTPFLLLAAACFTRSNPRFYRWLVEHPRLGQFILPYLNGSGMPKKAKIITLVLLWTGMGVSVWLVVPIIWGKLALLLIGLCVSVYIYRLPTLTQD